MDRLTTKKYHGLFALVLLLGLTGCDSGQSDRVDPSLVDAFADADRTTRGGPGQVSVTDAQAKAFADRWCQAIIEKDTSVVRMLVDWDGIMDRTFYGIHVSDEFRRDFTKEASSQESTEQLIGTIADEVNSGGSYRLVRVMQQGDRRHVILRLLNAEGALNYHDLRLRRIGGTVVADRLLFASSGQSFGETMRAMVAVAVAGQSSAFGLLSDDIKKEMKQLQRQAEMSSALRRGDKEGALAAYEGMPPEDRREKMSMLLRIMATDVDDESAYKKAIDDYRTYHPQDAVVGMITLDPAIFREDRDLLMSSHQHLVRLTGGDPYLDLMVGGVLANQGHLSEAKRMVESIDPSDLGLASAHDFKLTVAMADEDHAATLRQLELLRDDFGYELSDLSGVEGFEKFVASPEYQRWQASLDGSVNVK